MAGGPQMLTMTAAVPSVIHRGRSARSKGIAIATDFFGYFSAVLDHNDNDDARSNGLTCGKTITYADISVFAAVNYAITLKGKLGVLRGFAKLKEFHDIIGTPARSLCCPKA